MLWYLIIIIIVSHLDGFHPSGRLGWGDLRKRFWKAVFHLKFTGVTCMMVSNIPLIRSVWVAVIQSKINNITSFLFGIK